jgi:hypothetical protein
MTPRRRDPPTSVGVQLLDELDPSEVALSGGASSGGRSIRQPRSKGVTSCYWEAVHIPTGVYVQGEVPRGHYSRSQMKQLRDELLTLVYARLRFEVAKAERHPRRTSQHPDAEPPKGFTLSIGRYRPEQLRRRGITGKGPRE